MDAETKSRLIVVNAELAQRVQLAKAWTEQRVELSTADVHRLGREIAELRQLAEDLEASDD
jgi:hypothetical protein